MEYPDYSFPVDAIHKDFRGDARNASIPMSEGLVPLDLAVPGDIVALNKQFAGPNTEGENPTFEPDDWGVLLSVKTEDGYMAIDSIDLSADQLRKCAPALFVPAERRLIDEHIHRQIHDLCADDLEPRSIVVTQTACAAAIVTTSDGLWQKAFEFGDLDDPDRIDDFVRLFVLPCETAHERIEMRQQCKVFLDYVSKTFLSEVACGSPMHLHPGHI